MIKKKIRWSDDTGTINRDDVVDVPVDAGDDELENFLDGRRGKLKPSVTGPSDPNSDPDIVIGRNPNGDLQIDDYSGDHYPFVP